ncbi:MAG: non-canonical purine NTP pyrophosphatase [Candidatus Falkowbacteria bacterium]
MPTILLATHNKGKIQRYRALFGAFKDLELVTLNDLNITTKVDEPFATARENSIHKAKSYAEISGLPTIAIDEAVTTNFLPAGEQPGVFVRRFGGGKELSDAEVLAVWRKVFASYPDHKHEFVWDFSLSYCNPITKDLRATQAEQIDLVALNFSEEINPGYPMSSFLVPTGLDKTYIELDATERALVDQKNLKPFLDFMSDLLIGEK